MVKTVNIKADEELCFKGVIPDKINEKTISSGIKFMAFCYVSV